MFLSIANCARVFVLLDVEACIVLIVGNYHSLFSILYTLALGCNCNLGLECRDVMILVRSRLLYILQLETTHKRLKLTCCPDRCHK